jgi:hypothetical protein
MNSNRISNLNGKLLFTGIYAFSTTDATKEVSIPFGRIESISLTAIGAPAADEVLSVDETVSGTAGTDAANIRGSNSTGGTTVTVTRTGASKTSGLKFSLAATGY